MDADHNCTEHDDSAQLTGRSKITCNYVCKQVRPAYLTSLALTFMCIQSHISSSSPAIDDTQYLCNSLADAASPKRLSLHYLRLLCTLTALPRLALESVRLSYMDSARIGAQVQEELGKVLKKLHDHQELSWPMPESGPD